MKGIFQALRWGLSAWILWYVYHQIPLAKVWEAATHARTGLVLAACAGTLIMHFFTSLRLSLLMDAQGCRIGLGQLFAINLATLFYRMFLPGGSVASLGVRLYKYHQVEKNLAGMVSSLVLDRLLATCGLALLGLGCWLWDRPASLQEIGWLMLGAFLGLAVMCIVMLSGAGTSALQSFLAVCRAPWLAKKVPSWSGAVGKFRGLSGKQAAELVLLTLAAHAIGALTFACLAGAVGISAPLSTWGWIRCVVVLATLLPISVAGLGVRDGVLVYVLNNYGVPEAQVLALAFLIFGVTVVGVAALGGLLEAGTTFSTPGRKRVS